MKNPNPSVSQRLIRKGALVEETYNIFRLWDDEISFQENFKQALGSSFRSEGWKKEIYTTLNRRFRDLSDARSLIILARGRYEMSDWKWCLHFWVSLHEPLYGLFLDQWLYPQYQSGCLLLRAEDASHHVRKVWRYRNSNDQALSDYGVIRGARDLLRMARDFGILEGDGPTKKFASIHFSDDLFLYFCHVIYEAVNSSSRIVSSELWNLLFIDHDQVHSNLLRLHQYRKVDYQIAGSLIQLTLPCQKASEFAERMVA